ncbi:uncharacterized protein LOC127750599 [Frankliniella occidentalis]|uniref:Uncharacterized protein LOC127750599 n=1 Tax=Frankliniella occidentalis TaxID=133901 RepID=A0A9C6X3V8_FRAOC|nr:uncharacterized protein LOC127750599 [Frankliniella occidentalis]
MVHCGRRRHPVQRGGAAAAGGTPEENEWETEFALDGVANIHRLTMRQDDQIHDLNIALIANKERIIARVRQQLLKLKGLKFWLTVRVGASRETKDGIEEDEKFLRSQNHIVLPAHTCEAEVEKCILEIIDASDNLKLQGSSWQITEVFFIEVSMAKYSPMRGSSYIRLPPVLANARMGIINIQNKNDNECFRWCCLAAKYPCDRPHPERVTHYEDYYDTLNFGRMESADFKIDNIARFEKINPEFSFSVVTCNRDKVFHPLYASYEKSEIHVCLLYFSDTKGLKYHYALVTDMDQMLYSAVPVLALRMRETSTE